MKIRYQLVLLGDGSLGPTVERLGQFASSLGARVEASGQAWAWDGTFRSYDSIVEQVESAFRAATTTDAEGAVLFGWPQTWCGSCVEPYVGKMIRVFARDSREHAREAHKSVYLSRALAIVLPPQDSEECEHSPLTPSSKEIADELRKKIIEGAATIELQ